MAELIVAAVDEHVEHVEVSLAGHLVHDAALFEQVVEDAAAKGLTL